MKSVQTYKEIAENLVNILQRTISILMADVSLVETWCNLFSPVSSKCVQDHSDAYPTVEKDEELFASEGEQALNFELEQILVLEIFERVINSHRSQVNAIVKGPSKQVSCKFPCAICKKECIDVSVAKDATPEEDSILW